MNLTDIFLQTGLSVVLQTLFYFKLTITVFLFSRIHLTAVFPGMPLLDLEDGMTGGFWNLTG